MASCKCIYTATKRPLSVYVLPVANFDYVDNQLEIFDGVDNPVTTLANTIFVIVARKFLTARWSGVSCQCLNSADDTSAISLEGDGFDFFYSGRLDQNFIFSHAVSAP